VRRTARARVRRKRRYRSAGRPAEAPGRESAAELEAVRDLYERYRHSALRRFLADDDLDLRRCILPGLTLDPAMYPTEMHDQVAKAVNIARTSGDAYLRHRVEDQIARRG
jgi:hypothetical protein